MKVSIAKNKNCIAKKDFLKRLSTNEFCELYQIGENKHKQKEYFFKDGIGTFIVVGKLINKFFETNGYGELIVYENK